MSRINMSYVFKISSSTATIEISAFSGEKNSGTAVIYGSLLSALAVW
jgi:hypothetical protein